MSLPMRLIAVRFGCHPALVKRRVAIVIMICHGFLSSSTVRIIAKHVDNDLFADDWQDDHSTSKHDAQVHPLDCLLQHDWREHDTASISRSVGLKNVFIFRCTSTTSQKYSARQWHDKGQHPGATLLRAPDKLKPASLSRCLDLHTRGPPWKWNAGSVMCSPTELTLMKWNVCLKRYQI